MSIPERVKKIITYQLKGKGIEDEQMNYALLRAREMILNYCHIGEVPDKVYFTWVAMSVDLLKEAFPDKFSTDSPTMSNVSSISVGDTSINLGGKMSEVLSSIELENRLISSYKTQLRSIREIAL